MRELIINTIPLASEHVNRKCGEVRKIQLQDYKSKFASQTMSINKIQEEKKRRKTYQHKPIMRLWRKRLNHVDNLNFMFRTLMSTGLLETTSFPGKSEELMNDGPVCHL